MAPGDGGTRCALLPFSELNRKSDRILLRHDTVSPFAPQLTPHLGLGSPATSGVTKSDHFSKLGMAPGDGAPAVVYAPLVS